MPSQLGEECKLYYDVAGAEVGSWVEADVIIDDGDTFERRTAESNCRGFTEVKEHVGKPKYTLSGTLLFQFGDTEFTALQAAAQANTNLGIAVMNGAIATASNKGWWRDMRFSQWNETRPDGDTVKVAFTLVTNASSSYASNFKTISGA